MDQNQMFTDTSINYSIHFSNTKNSICDFLYAILKLKYVKSAFLFISWISLPNINMYSCQSSILLISEENSSQSNPETDRIIKSLFDLEQKKPQYFGSPKTNLGIKNIELRSPSPFKKSLLAGESDQIKFDEHPNSLLSTHQKEKFICQVIDFYETPNRQSRKTEGDLGIKISKSPYSGTKESKGLRNLSQNVYQIVLSLKITTYKQVALRLVSELSHYRNDSQQAQEKDERNIKRRVYDALNVLIAADVLKKKGKKVIVNNKMIPQKMLWFENIVEQKTYLQIRQQILERQLELQKKREKLIELESRKKKLQAIVRRNMKKRSDKQKRIYFPFVGLTCERYETLYSSMNNRELVSIKVRNLEQIMGDTDLLLMGMDIISHGVDEIMDAEVNDEESHYPEFPSFIVSDLRN